MLQRVFCRDISLQVGEPVYGTSGFRQSWILLQDHAPWGIRAFDHSALPDPVKSFLRGLFKKPKPPILFIRNSDERNIPVKKCFVVRSTEMGSAVHEFEWSQPEELLHLPLAQALAGEPINIVEKKLILVCTHGKRDKCCAKYGMPLYNEIKQDFPEETWRSSHVGGDRFAANMVCLPEGIYYGRVTPAAAKTLVHSFLEEKLELEFLRGRSCYTKAVQVADYFIRRETGINEITRLRLKSHEETSQGHSHVSFLDTQENRIHSVEISVRHSDFENLLACRDHEPETIPLYRLESYSVVSG